MLQGSFKYVIVLFLSGFFTSLCANCQDVVLSDSIIIEPTFNGNDFIYQGKKIGPGKALALMENNEEAYDVMAKAHESYVFGNLFCVIGCGLLVYPIASSFFDKDPNWIISASGAGLILISIPIFVNYDRQSSEAILMYNSKLATIKSQGNQSSLRFGVIQNRVGLVMNF